MLPNANRVKLQLERGEIIAKAWQKQQEDNSEREICYLVNICVNY